ncbi:EAL domain-containing protein [Neobacillus mesonae]|uniref:EAL domain-containing protein n=1 Tax=Neobacillus mesonae TaxID=1193713 RepID=UPI00203B08C2|nr:EAL domain-containing protein [Neobacillus mesonae]MCM3570452.1 EAL domain-containing protein [Neobacillus mesonae]
MRLLSNPLKSYFLHQAEKTEQEQEKDSIDESFYTVYNEDMPSNEFNHITEDSILNFSKIHSILLDQEELIFVTNNKGIIIYINEKCSSSLGYRSEELVGISWKTLESDKHAATFYRDIWKILSHGDVWKGELSAKTKDGSIKWYDNSIYPLLDENGRPHQFLTIRRDITDLKNLEDEQKVLIEEMENLANFDSLTGLPNQRYLEEHLKKEIEFAEERNTNLAIVRIGIDDFRYINNTLGHSTGNMLLKEFSRRMKKVLNENVYIHKMSGDHFTIIIKDIVEYEEIHKTLDHLLEVIHQDSFIVDRKEVHVTVSMGASVFPYSGERADILIKNAEIAMYHAKQSGKNQYQIFSSTMSVNSYKQFVLRNDSKKALLKNEFNIYYQPRINPKTNEMVSAEALIRWIHPEWGLILPDEFISMAEGSGLIIPIGEWVVRQICLKMKQWEKEGLPIKKVSINLSPIQLLQLDFVDIVSSIINELNINPNWLEFEITETMFIENEEEVSKALTALKKMGITIALDDFGTGYSSLNYLKKFPCDIVKIDKSLIDDVHRDKDNYEIIASTIALCHKLHKTVVAEGVETEEQLTLLKRLHCDEIQGYFYSKPVEENEYKRYLTQGFGFKQEESVSYQPGENKRRYFRVLLKYPLLADMTIEQVESKKVNLGSTEIKVEDIGPGGLRFSSSLKLPVSNGVVFCFSTEIFTKESNLKGNIVWKKELQNNVYRYGVKFILDQKEQEELIRVLNQLQIRLRRNSILEDCRFVKNE